MAFGRLERSPGPQPMSDINMTPLIDVMLVLVVIFILTAPLLASSLRLDLPRTDAAQAQQAVSAVQVALDKSGQVYLNDQPVELVVLQQRLAQIALQNPQTELQLRADQTVPYGRVVEVMGAAQQAGLNRIGFVAKP
jgi:biopolymer transport protein TolR